MSSPQDDLYLLALARQLRSEDVLHVGASQLEVWQAAEVAKRLWAPGLRVVAACTYHLGGRGAAGAELLRSRNYARDVIAARQATFTQSRVFDDLQRSRVLFSGALQVDAMGNANLIGFMSGDHYVRGPGSAGLPTLTSHSERFFFALQRHTRANLVARVHKITVLGNRPERRALGLPDAALQEVITPLASFRADDDGLALAAISPGVKVDEIRRNTGFEVRLHAEYAPRPAITDEEAHALAAVRGQA